MTVDVSAGFLEHLADFGDDPTEPVEVNVGKGGHLDVGLVAPGHALKQFILGEDLTLGAKVAVPGMDQCIPYLTLQLLGSLNHAIDPPLDSAQGVDPRPSSSGHLALATLISDLEVRAPLRLLERREQSRGEQDVVSEDNDLIIVCEPPDALGDLLCPAVVKTGHRVVEDNWCRDACQSRLSEEIGKGQDLLLALGQYLGRLVFATEHLAALSLPLSTNGLDLERRRAERVTLFKEQGIKALVDQLVTSCLS